MDDKIECLTCEYCMLSGFNSWCRKEDRIIMKNDIIEGRPDWCPLLEEETNDNQ